MTRQLTHGSLFSGIGGAEIAAHWAGFRNLFHCDINPFGRTVLDYWFPQSQSYGDIKQQDFTEWRGRLTVLSGGFPCQPFSCAGKRKGADDDRYLWPEAIRVIREAWPAWFVGENVGGLVSMVERAGDNVRVEEQADLFGESRNVQVERLRFTLHRICDDLEEAGYAVQPIIIPACAVGAPHRRDRVWILARREDDPAAQVPEHDGRVHHLGEERTQNGRLGDVGAGVNERVLQTDAADTLNERREGGASLETDRDGISSWFGGFGRPQPSTDPDGPSNAPHGSVKRNGTGDVQERRQRELRGNVDGLSASQHIINGSEEVPARLIPSDRGFKGFPSFAPLCLRDDGLPDELVDRPVYRGRPKLWRSEALKALGNAWVPQVAYEIFKAMAEIELNSSNND